MKQYAWSLRWLIGGIYFVIMVTLLGPLAFYISRQAEEQYMSNMVQPLLGQARLGAELLAPKVNVYLDILQRKQADTSAALPVPSVRDDLELQQKQLDITDVLRTIHRRCRPGEDVTARHVTLLGLDGTIIADPQRDISDLPRTTMPEVRQALAPSAPYMGWGQDIRYDKGADERILYVAVPVQTKKPVQTNNLVANPPLPGQISSASGSTRRPHTEPVNLGVLVLAAPLTHVDEEITNINIAIGLTFVGVLVVLLFIIAGVSSYISEPLAKLSVAAMRFADGHLEERVEPRGAAEVASLGRSFNLMTEQLRQTITRLAEERAQAEAMLVSMVDGVIVTDITGKVLILNHAAEEVCTQPVAQAIGQPLAAIIADATLNEMLEQILGTWLPLQGEIMIAEPVECTLEVHLAPVQVDGHPRGVVIVLYDITTQRKLEQVRRDFVANVSHELRTPVTSIRAMAETLQDVHQEDPQATAEFLQTITTESERLTSMLDDLLQLSRIESNRRLVKPREIDAGKVIRHVVDRVITPITVNSLQLALDVPAHIPIVVDPDAFTQILVNLLDNARKYSPDGGVIRVSLTKDEVVCLRVTDTGIGISADELDRIFERFYRVDKARSRAQGGTGLGLAIVKHLVELHHGRIYVESTLGVGSTFTVILPQPDPDDAPRGELSVSFSGEPIPEEVGESSSGVPAD